MHFVPVDFEHDDLTAALEDARFEHRTPSMFLWEGVTNYLTHSAVDSTLHAVRNLASSGDLLIVTYVDRAVIDGDLDAFPETRRWIEGVKRRGEPWTFGLTPPRSRTFSPSGASPSSRTSLQPMLESSTSTRSVAASEAPLSITLSLHEPRLDQVVAIPALD